MPLEVRMLFAECRINFSVEVLHRHSNLDYTLPLLLLLLLLLLLGHGGIGGHPRVDTRFQPLGAWTYKASVWALLG